MSTATAPAVAPRQTPPLPQPMILSTLAAKYWMAVTGFLLVGFVIVHMVGNLQIFAGPDKINAYAKMLKDLGPLLWVARGVLLAVFLLHIYLALTLSKRNRAARPSKYVYQRTLKASPASRYMLLTGLVILAFVIFHLAHYTLGLVQQITVVDAAGQAKTVSLLDLHDEKGRHDVYAMLLFGFRQWPIVVAYLVAQIILVLHLYHGASSMFQSLGINHPRYNWLLHRVGLAVAVLIGAGNLAMPLAVFFGLVGAGYQPRIG